MKEFLKYIGNCHRGRAAVLVLMGTLSALTSVLMNYSLEYAVDFVFRTGNTGLWKAIPLFLFMAAATYLTDQLGENYCVEKCRLVFVKDMREKLIKSYHLLPFEKAREKNRGELMNRDEMTNDAGDLFVSLAYELPYCLLESVGFFLFLGISVSWKMDLVLAILLPFAVVFRKLTMEIRRKNGEIMEKKEDSHRFFLDVISKLDFVRGNGFSGETEAIYKRKNGRMLETQKQLFGRNEIFSFLQFVLENSVKFLVPAAGAWLLLAGDITPGGLAVSTTIFSAFLVPSLFQMIGLWKEIGGAGEVIEKLMREIHGEDAGIQEKTAGKGTAEVIAMEENVLLKAVEISAESRGEKIFRRLSLELPPTGCIGISGPSGEGKSTLCKILAGLLMPSEGKVLYNGSYFSWETPQNNIAYSAPENFFMETSVMDNLKAGGEYAAKVRQIPQIRELLKALPEREETVLEEGARNLSGGQRQLLALARVMAKENARIWILDEPAASLDLESRRQMGELIRQAAKERCVLVITHQEDLLEQMQVSYELRDGRIMRHTGEHS